jgi:hypothetical protein
MLSHNQEQQKDVKEFFYSVFANVIVGQLKIVDGYFTDRTLGILLE